MKGPGLKPPTSGLLNHEVIGPPDCPIMHRWTVAKLGGWKLMAHRFLPNADDRDIHDHPSPFWTFVLRGGYDDLVPCPECGERVCCRDLPGCDACERCDAHGVVLGERMRAGMLRRRPARHAHRTRVLPSGAWTVVLMGPKERPWGFWRLGRWWAWRDYERTFGFGMRCDTDEDTRGA